MKQIERVMAHLKPGQTLTSLQAWEWFGVTRLSDIIYKIKRRGKYIVKSEPIEVLDRYGHKTTVSRYSITPMVLPEATPAAAVAPDEQAIADALPSHPHPESSQDRCTS